MLETESTRSLPNFLWLFFISFCVLTNPLNSATDTSIFSGCSQHKYLPNSPYESNVKSLLTSLVNSAKCTNYNNFTIQGSTTQDTLYGLFQCRGDLKTDECARCVAQVVSQLGTICLDSCGGALQTEGCFVKYDNIMFLGVEDKCEMSKKCGPSIGYEADMLTQRDGVLAYLGKSDGITYKPYRFGSSRDFQGMAQCVSDLSLRDCNDCLSEATQQLKTECGPAKWGEMYLAKCYLQYLKVGDHLRTEQGHDQDEEEEEEEEEKDDDDDDDDDEKREKTRAILIGLTVGVFLLIIFLFFFRQLICKKIKKWYVNITGVVIVSC